MHSEVNLIILYIKDCYMKFIFSKNLMLKAVFQQTADWYLQIKQMFVWQLNAQKLYKNLAKKLHVSAEAMFWFSSSYSKGSKTLPYHTLSWMCTMVCPSLLTSGTCIQSDWSETRWPPHLLWCWWLLLATICQFMIPSIWFEFLPCIHKLSLK